MKVVILRGVSGSGKTTFAVENYPNALVCSADQYFYTPDGEYEFKPHLLSEAHVACFSKFLLMLQANHNADVTLVVDNTNSTICELSPYYMAACVYGAQITVIRTDCRSEIAANRNRHGVPMHTIQNMRNRFEPLPGYWVRERIVRTDETRD